MVPEAVATIFLVSMWLAGTYCEWMKEIFMRIIVELGGWPSRLSIHLSQSWASSQIGEKGMAALISTLEERGIHIGAGEDAQPPWANQDSCCNQWVCHFGKVTVFKFPGDERVLHVHIQGQESAGLVLLMLRPANSP